ncbi:MerR family transcriptional regulator [Paenibacillus sp. 481]|nr:MerR family transcriptional regulator [Paenibacillus sp. 481]
MLGVSRDALRYYEEQGIVNPRHNEVNHYRQYDYYDIYTLMVADFYKKRNLSIKEVHKLQAGSEIEDLEALLAHKAMQLENTIRLQQHMLCKINETKQFCAEIHKHVHQYSIRPFPTYEVMGEISDFNAFREYPAANVYFDRNSVRRTGRMACARVRTNSCFLDDTTYFVRIQSNFGTAWRRAGVEWICLK